MRRSKSLIITREGATHGIGERDERKKLKFIDEIITWEEKE